MLGTVRTQRKKSNILTRQKMIFLFFCNSFRIFSEGKKKKKKKKKKKGMREIIEDEKHKSMTEKQPCHPTKESAFH